MPEYVYPGVYVEEIDEGPHPISGVSTTVAAFVGFAPSGPLAPTAITSFLDYSQTLGGFGPDNYLAYAVQGCSSRTAAYAAISFACRPKCRATVRG